MSLRFAQAALLGNMVVVAAPKPMPVIERVAAIAASPVDVPYRHLAISVAAHKTGPRAPLAYEAGAVLSRPNDPKFNKQA